jgi:transposase
MAQPFSIDLRERVVAAVSAGATVREAALRFSVAASTVVKWTQRQRATGSVAPGKMGGHRRPVVREKARAFIVMRITQKPDLTVRALQSELLAQGIEASRNTVWLCLRSERLSCKKNRVRSRTDAAQDNALPRPLEDASAQDRSKAARLCGRDRSERLPLTINVRFRSRRT